MALRRAVRHHDVRTVPPERLRRLGGLEALRPELEGRVGRAPAAREGHAAAGDHPAGPGVAGAAEREVRQQLDRPVLCLLALLAVSGQAGALQRRPQVGRRLQHHQVLRQLLAQPGVVLGPELVQRAVVAAPYQEYPLVPLIRRPVEHVERGLQIGGHLQVVAEAGAMEEKVAAVQKDVAIRQPQVVVPAVRVAHRHAPEGAGQLLAGLADDGHPLLHVHDPRVPSVLLLPAAQEAAVAEAQEPGRRGQSDVADVQQPADVDLALSPSDLVVLRRLRHPLRDLAPHRRAGEGGERLEGSEQLRPRGLLRALGLPDLDSLRHAAHGLHHPRQHLQNGLARAHSSLPQGGLCQGLGRSLAHLRDAPLALPAARQGLSHLRLQYRLVVAHAAHVLCGVSGASVPPDARIDGQGAAELEIAGVLPSHVRVRGPDPALSHLVPAQVGATRGGAAAAAEAVDGPALAVEALVAELLWGGPAALQQQGARQEDAVDLLSRPHEVAHVGHEREGPLALLQEGLLAISTRAGARPLVLKLPDNMPGPGCKLVAQPCAERTLNQLAKQCCDLAFEQLVGRRHCRGGQTIIT
mmetsp:Transcript_136429/g.331688  ORF Transcript_136429/g.331688 Transcript_136429/m.331688 type:complete len:581 (+) Transcript_136429:260-2002(+)